MNKRNIKHSFKKAWCDLKEFWCNLFAKVKNRNNEKTKKHPILLFIFNVGLILLAFFSAQESCASLIDNEGSVLSVYAEETNHNTTLLAEDYASLKSLFVGDVLFRQTYHIPYTSSYFYQLSSSYDFDVDLQPLGDISIDFVYNVTKGCYVAFSYSDVIFNTNLGITVPIFSGFYSMSNSLSGDTVYFYPRVPYYDIGGDSYYILEFYCALAYDTSFLTTYNNIVCVETQLFDYCSTSLNPYNPSGSATNLFSTLFQKQATPTVSFPFTLYSMLGDSRDFNFMFNNGNSFVTNNYGNIVLNKYMYYFNGDTYEVFLNPYDLFLTMPFYNMPTGFVSYGSSCYFPPVSGDSNDAFLRGKDYGYDLGLEDGFEKGYGEGYGDAIIEGGGTTEFWRGYEVGKKDGAVEEYNRVVTELKPAWQEEAKQAEYNRVLTELKPAWQEEAKQAEYNRVVTELKPIWQEESYSAGLRDGQSSSGGGLTYSDGYKDGKEYAELNLKPAWQEEAKQAERNYIIQYEKPAWQEEAKQAERNYIINAEKPIWQEEAKQAEYNRVVTELKPIWEQDAYNNGLRDGKNSSSGGLTYADGYKAGKEYSELNLKPAWQEEAKQAEYNRVVKNLKPIWQEEARQAERNYIIQYEKPAWEQEAYDDGLRDGLNENTVEFDPLSGLKTTLNTLFSVPMFGDNISISVLFTVAMGILLFVCILKIFFGG